jgi:hypothetical protein
MEEYVGKTLGPYQILELIGTGGMAGVFRAHQPSMNRNVAIKIMAENYSGDELFSRRFINEGRVIAQLEHANILPVYDFGEQDGVLYIVMRYLDAGTLGDRITEEGMPLDEVVRIFSQLASALSYAHSRKVIHRDLKPGNVLIDAQGHAYLTDFGIAKSLEADQNLTGTDNVVGTPNYMAPEQGLGEPIDNRADIYALGVMLFEMLTGQRPFDADSQMAVMLKHIQEPPPAPRSINPDVPPLVEAVVLKALAKDREGRFQNVEEMATALEQAAQGKAVPSLKQTSAGTKPVAAASAPAGTMASPIPAQPGGATGPAPASTEPAAAAPAPGRTAPGATAPAAAAKVGEVQITLNSISAWLGEREGLGYWLQSFALSLATFIILSRLTTGGTLENLILSLIPGLLVYGLLGAPTLGGLIAFALILVPLLPQTPGLALIWLAMLIVSGARLNYREIMLIIVTTVAAGTPLGWLIPLLMPWWMRVRRTVLPSALGVSFAMLFAITLGWPDAGGLLPTPFRVVAERLSIGDVPFGFSYLGLFNPDVWRAWGEPDLLWDNVRVTFSFLGRIFLETNGLPLLIAVAWALAAVLTVSNRRVQSPVWRMGGMLLSLGVLLVAHLTGRPDSLSLVEPVAVGLGLVSAVIAFALSQWPIQVDPNRGNKAGTVLRMLRQSLGALFMALGVIYFSQFAGDAPLRVVLWIGGIIGTLVMLVNPLIGPPIVFASVVAGLYGTRPALIIATAILLFVYLIVTLMFDRRRPQRRWNPIGAGLILGAPGMASAGLLTLGPLSIGALEAQLPAAILAMTAHVLLVMTADDVNPLRVLIQIIVTLVGVLGVERLMGQGPLPNLHQKVRRLIFTVGVVLLLALGYYGLGGLSMRNGSLLSAVFLSLITGVALVIAMGDRAMYWRRFVEPEEREEDITDDDEITGKRETARRRSDK